MADPAARGTAFLGILKHLREVHGPAALAEVIATAVPATRQVLAKRVLSLSWYPYAAFVGLLRAAESGFGAGDPAYCKTLGRVAGERDLNTVFKLFVRLYGPERLIGSCTRVWSQYYRDAGTMLATHAKPEDTRVRIEGFPRMDTSHCRLMEGWMIQTMHMLGARVAEDGRETACPSRGDAFHEFRCTWTLARDA